MRTPALLLLAAVVSSFNAGAQSSSGAAILARVGDTFVSEDEFVRRFELLPGIQRSKNRLEEEKLVTLYSLAAEKLLAQEASARGLDQDSLVRSSLDDLQKTLARDALYREEVLGKVSVTPAEIKAGMRNALRQLFVSYLYFEKEDDAKFIRSRIRSRADFDRLTLDSTMDAAEDTVTMSWGTSENSIETAAFALKQGETSPVVPARTGYYILHVTKETTNGLYRAMQPGVFRERVEAKLRARKEEARLNDYMAAVLKDETGYARATPLTRLAQALEDLYGKEAAGQQQRIPLNQEMRSRVMERCAGDLSDTLAVAGSVVWSVQEVIDKLYGAGFSVGWAEIPKIPQKLNAQIRTWVWQELMAQEALRRGLDRSPAVVKQMAEWKTSFLAHFMKLYANRAVSVSDAEVYKFMQATGLPFDPPSVRLRELQTSTILEMQKAMADLENGIPFAEVVQRYSNDPAARDNGGLTRPFPVTERDPLGAIAAGMHVGEFYGPMRVQGGMLYFQLAEKRDSSALADTSYVARVAHAHDELLKMKQRRTRNLLLAQLAQQKGVTVYQDRLSALKVSATPMMSFRILGFGGRMFAAPMVDRQIEWLNVEPPQAPVLP